MVEDADFWIYQYPTHVQCLSAAKLDYTTLFEDGISLKTDCYSRQELADHLDEVAHRDAHPQTQPFQVGHLPMLASLKGNSIIPHRMLFWFHRKTLGNFLNPTLSDII